MLSGGYYFGSTDQERYVRKGTLYGPVNKNHAKDHLMSQGVATRGLHLFRRGSCAALHVLYLEWFFQAQLACHNTWCSFERGLKGNPFLVVHALPITLLLVTFGQSLVKKSPEAFEP